MENALVKRLILTPLEKVYLSIGTNVGDRYLNILNVLGQIRERIGVIEDSSSIYLSESWGFDSNDFYNLVILVEVSTNARGLLEELKSIERKMGRTATDQKEGFQSRVIDLDILTYGPMMISEPGLKVPHVGLANRNFVLMPWAEIAAELEVPGTELTVAELLRRCPDTSKCERIEDV